MNIPTAIGWFLLIITLVPSVFIVWFDFCYDFCDKHKMGLIGHMCIYLAPFTVAGLIFLCYGLVVHPIINPPKEESAMTKEEMQKTLDKHMHDLVEHFANVDHKQVYHPETNQPGVYITHMEFVDINGIVNMMKDLEE